MTLSTTAWILVLVPLAAAAQLALVTARNRARRWIHRPKRPQPAPTTAPLQRVIAEELDAVFGHHFLARNDGLSPSELGGLATRLAGTVAVRVAARVPLSDSEQRTLQRELPASVRRELELERGAPTYRP